MNKTPPSPGDQRSNIKNPNNPTYQDDMKNREAQQREKSSPDPKGRESGKSGSPKR